MLSEEKPGCRENNGVVIGDASRVYLFMIHKLLLVNLRE